MMTANGRSRGKNESEVGELHRRGVAQGKSWGRGGINCPASSWLFLLADEGDDLPLVLAGSRARGGIGLCLAGFVTGEVVLPGSPLDAHAAGMSSRQDVCSPSFP